MNKLTLLMLAFVSSMTLSLATHAAEDSYNCIVKNVPGNASTVVTASSSGEAVDKAKKDAESLKAAYGLSYLDVRCTKKS
jgi:predicted ATPase